MAYRYLMGSILKEDYIIIGKEVFVWDITLNELLFF